MASEDGDLVSTTASAGAHSASPRSHKQMESGGDVVKIHNPSSIGKPLGAYSHGIEVPSEARLLYIAGQVGVSSDGTIPKTFEEQVDLVWTNIRTVLASAGMKLADIVKMSTFITRPENYAKARLARTKYLVDHRPASTAVVVVALADPALLIEVEAVAAKEHAK